MSRIEIVTVTFFCALSAAGWVAEIRSRPLRARLQSLVEHNPPPTQRGYAMRVRLSELADLRYWASAATTMSLAMLLMGYLVYGRGFPDGTAVLLFLGISFPAILFAAFKSDRFAHRVGLTCPGCKAQLGDARGHSFLYTGRCAVCKMVVFRLPLGARKAKPLSPRRWNEV
jgi:hypothetical protein